ncbi:MAG: protein-glutamate O-methyltransferase family protein [Anaerolineae bacterium]|nr:protein-glutamate O-methyltransferase family protein [Anaerolineae bacterium]
MASPAGRPSPLTMDNWFARYSMTGRVPRILREVLESNPDYPASIHAAIERLRQDLLDGAPIPMLADEPAPAPDYDDWAAAYREQRARTQPLTWQHNVWFFAETFLYRCLIQAVRWRETGRDPFAPIKQAELESERLWAAFDQALAIEEADPGRVYHLLLASLWGNRADLSHVAGDLAAGAASEDDLLVDDRAALVEHLASAPPDAGPVHLVIDNAGLELMVDLALVDALITDGHRVVMHVKAYPVFVSDATISDVWQTLAALEQRGGRPRALAERLRRAWGEMRLRLAAPPLWTSSRFVWEMPPAMRQVMSQSRVVIFKGDANYRRVIGDAIWDERASFAEAVRYFPGPVVALRSIKSDALVGIDPARRRALDGEDTRWRTTGRFGVIQFVGAPARRFPV